jgi:hypothetical protein
MDKRFNDLLEKIIRLENTSMMIKCHASEIIRLHEDTEDNNDNYKGFRSETCVTEVNK